MSARRLALDPPADDLFVIDDRFVDHLLAASRASPRGRLIAPMHRTLEDLLHRMFNALQPGTYVHPHRHRDPPKPEAWIILRGAVGFFLFSDEGRVLRAIELRAGGERWGVDLTPGHYHTLVALEPDTLIYEVKSGPYDKGSDKEFAPWAPNEGDAGTAQYMATLTAHLEGPTS